MAHRLYEPPMKTPTQDSNYSVNSELENESFLRVSKTLALSFPLKDENSSLSKRQKTKGGGGGGGGEGKRVSKTEEEEVGIGRLPDAMLCHILSFLETEYSVRASLLSKRWRYFWTTIPCIDIQYPKDEGFTDFFDRFLQINTVSCLRKFDLSLFKYHKHLSKWINIVLKRDIEELVVSIFGAYQHVKLPPSFFTSKKLVILKLIHGIRFDVPASVYLPSLKILHLCLGDHFNKDSMTNLLDGCPVLEELNIEVLEDRRVKTLIVSSSTLKTLIINYKGYTDLRIVVDVPNVERLDLLGNRGAHYDMRSLDSLVKAYICTGGDSLINRLVRLLGKVNNTRYLLICSGIMSSVTSNRLVDVPTFHKLTHLVLDNFDHCWRVLPALLESSPNLVTFVSRKGLSHCEQQLQFTAPKGLMLYLEEIELSNFTGLTYEMDMVRYFLDNATILKKLSIQYDYLHYSEISNKLLTYARVSPECEIIFVV